MTRIDRLYGGAFTIQVGDLVQERLFDRGEWSITCWGGDAILAVDAVVVDDRVVSRAELLERLVVTVGRVVDTITLEPESMMLSVRFSPPAAVMLHRDLTMTDEAWSIEGPSGEEFLVDSDGRWEAKYPGSDSR